jgi:hypothetical protein
MISIITIFLGASFLDKLVTNEPPVCESAASGCFVGDKCPEQIAEKMDSASDLLWSVYQSVRVAFSHEIAEMNIFVKCAGNETDWITFSL